MADSNAENNAANTRKRSASPARDAPAAASGSASASEDPTVKRVKLEEGGSENAEQQQPSSPTTSNSRGGRGNDRGNNRGRGSKRGRGARKDNYSRNGGQPKQQFWGAREKVDKQRDSGWRNKEDGDNDDDNTGLNRDGTPKLKKKKVAMLIGYSGLGYNGSQINPGVKTIEQDVFDACVKAGAISRDNSDNTQKVSLMRAARTDAGVSAAINVLNLKLILSPPDMPEKTTLEAHINSFLPSAIRIWKIIRVTGGFHSRTMCDSRMYNYSLPTYCFLDPKPGTSMGDKRTKNAPDAENWWTDKMCTQQPAADENAAKTEGAKPVKAEEATEAITGEVSASANGETPEVKQEGEGSEDAAQAAPSAFREDQKLRKGYRIQPDTLQRVKDMINAYRGSHNFWNFTVGKEFSDRSCQRVMKNLTVTDPFIVGDSEWISLKFHGQSFMLHQIRKMVALIIMAVRTHTPPSLIPETFGPARLNVPKAPALGLLLEQPQFESYNRKIRTQNQQVEKRIKKDQDSKSASGAAADETPSKSTSQQPADDGEDEANAIRDPVEYASFENEVESFKREIVFKNMHEEEEGDDTYGKWLNLHDNQIGTDFDYLNAKGVIPTSAHLPNNKKKPKPAAQAEASGAKVEGTAAKPEEDEEDQQLARLNAGKNSNDLEG